MENQERWIEVDARGAELVGRQGALDVEIGDWLLEVRALEVHARLGYGTLAEYVERRVGLVPHATAERLRVADALRDLGKAREALRGGGLTWSAARELTRVAVPATEDEWLEAAKGKTVREVEDLVSGRSRGDRPTDPADPRLRRFTLRFEIGPETYATWREVVRVLQKEIDPSLSEEEALMEIAQRVLGGPGDEGRAPYQIAISRCEDCGRAWQDARGETVELTPEAAECAGCDAQQIGPSHGGRSGRATQKMPPSVRRQVVQRDKHRCRVPGCRSATFVHIHHLDLRSEGGSHDATRALCLCSAHHRRVHEGLLLIEGAAAVDARFFHADGTEYGSGPSPEEVSVLGHAFGALRHLGFGETETKKALAVVRSPGGRAQDLEDVVRAALRVLTDGAPVSA